MAKSFFNRSLFNEEIDHGNHYATDKYMLTDLCLVHYHCRNIDQMKKKVYNNVSGLGYEPFNLSSLKSLLKQNDIAGLHHIENQIAILENKYELELSEIKSSDIDLTPISKYILNLPHFRAK
jgi:hypothetical protein